MYSVHTYGTRFHHDQVLLDCVVGDNRLVSTRPANGRNSPDRAVAGKSPQYKTNSKARVTADVRRAKCGLGAATGWAAKSQPSREQGFHALTSGSHLSVQERIK
ncbi:MAG: hypothetical protein ACE5R6_20935 [Candidatus Heimdallarchaeota archaeon]